MQTAQERGVRGGLPVPGARSGRRRLRSGGTLWTVVAHVVWCREPSVLTVSRASRGFQQQVTPLASPTMPYPYSPMHIMWKLPSPTCPTIGAYTPAVHKYEAGPGEAVA